MRFVHGFYFPGLTSKTENRPLVLYTAIIIILNSLPALYFYQTRSKRCNTPTAEQSKIEVPYTWKARQTDFNIVVVYFDCGFYNHDSRGA